MIRDALEYEVVRKRVRYLETQLEILLHDRDDDEATLTQRARLRVEIDDKKKELADYVSGVSQFR